MQCSLMKNKILDVEIVVNCMFEMWNHARLYQVKFMKLQKTRNVEGCYIFNRASNSIFKTAIREYAIFIFIKVSFQFYNYGYLLH